MPRRLPGTRRRCGKLTAYVDVVVDGKPKQITATFDPSITPAADIAAWRTKIQNQHAPKDAPAPSSIAALCLKYLESVRSMPTYHQRAAHLQLWVEAIGPQRSVSSITAHQLNVIMDGWARTPSNQPDPTILGRRGRPSATTGIHPATIKKRRAALRAMFNAMHGKSGNWNPVRDTRCPVVPSKPDARGISMADAERLIAAMPDRHWISQGISRPALNKRRAAVMLWTGFPPKVIGSISRTDLQLTSTPPTVRVRRHKGTGIEERAVPLSPQAVAAWQALIAADGLGPFQEGPLNVSVKRAGRQAGLTLPANFTAYALRHSFGSALYAQTKDLALVGRQLLHAEHSTQARRYTQAAHAEVDAAAMAQFGQGPLPSAAPPASVKNPVKQPTTNKRSYLQRV